MPVCNDPSCSCKRVRRGVYKSPLGEEDARQRKARTLRRLERVPGLTIEHKGHAVWLAANGHSAPVIVQEGHVSIRTEFPSQPNLFWTAWPLRENIPVRSSIHSDPKRLFDAIRRAHEAYPAHERRAETFRLFCEIIGRGAKVEGLEDGDRAMVSASMRLTLDEAARFRAFLDSLGGKP